MDETYVPGLNREMGRRETTDETVVPGMSRNNDKEETPIVGYLYSLSRGGEPESWPLHIGQNKIGKDADMDICLAEASVTGHHANINIKRLRRSGNALSASIVDVGSKNGIILNEEELDYEPHTIHNEDLIIFGLNYKCVVILIDPTKYGLEESPEFVATTPKAKKAQDDFAGMMPEMPAADPFEGFSDNATINISGPGIDLGGGATKIL